MKKLFRKDLVALKRAVGWSVYLTAEGKDCKAVGVAVRKVPPQPAADRGPTTPLYVHPAPRIPSDGAHGGSAATVSGGTLAPPKTVAARPATPLSRPPMPTSLHIVQRGAAGTPPATGLQDASLSSENYP
ncbi:hypothetical protein SNE40_012168 [Patella caerulea]|uniref:Uncharacterized protein n=1 Tax=Patella caerulea TaxID=87958 RepID=A0AAN8JNL1_PATCE